MVFMEKLVAFFEIVCDFFPESNSRSIKFSYCAAMNWEISSNFEWLRSFYILFLFNTFLKIGLF